MDLKNTKNLIKWKLKGDKVTFEGHERERKQIYDLFDRTSEFSESNSALLIGPRRSGKTTMLRSIINSLEDSESFRRNTIIVQLNGLVHTDDGLALDAIARDMQLDTLDMNGKVFGSFAENLLFLLESFKSGDRNKSKGIIFILEEFDLFCAHHNQTLLYNLFDVAQSAQAPICVLGTTSRDDVIELLEKRVKSRFSHRQFYLNPNIDFDVYMDLFVKLLTITNQDLNLKKNLQISEMFVKNWNESIKSLSENKDVRLNLDRQFQTCTLIASLKALLFQVISYLSDTHPVLVPQDFIEIVEKSEADAKISILCDLSVMELCLVVAMKHHCEIYDRDPFNFEMILTRFNKFAASTSTFQNISRDVVQKAFERILQLEFITPISSTGGNSSLKNFRMYWLNLLVSQINTAVMKYAGLPTDISQWATTSPI